MPQALTTKRDFATRLSRETLWQLDELTRWGKFKTRTAVIEAAVKRLYEAERRDPERLRRALEASCGALPGGTTRESFKAAEFDRLDWEYERATGRRS